MRLQSNKLVAEDRDQWWNVVNTVMDLRGSQSAGNFS
jgi:hypothetical protein